MAWATMQRSAASPCPNNYTQVSKPIARGFDPTLDPETDVYEGVFHEEFVDRYHLPVLQRDIARQ